MQENYSISILSSLLSSGALLCSLDTEHVTPLMVLQTQPAKLNVMQFISLKCLAVKVDKFMFDLIQTFYLFQELKKSCISVSAEDVGETCFNFYNLHS